MIMKKTILLSICTMLVLTACVSKKDYLALQEKQKDFGLGMGKEKKMGHSMTAILP